MGRFWTPDEDAKLRTGWKSIPTPSLASSLERTVSSLYQRANKLGLCDRRNPFTPEQLAQIRRLHAEGLSSSEIAAEMGCSRRWLGEVRSRLGIEPNGRNERYRQKVAQKIAQQCDASGVKSLAQVRVLAFRKFAASHGWPEDLRPRHVHILHALGRFGTLTRRQIVEALGMVWRGTRKSLKSNDPEGSYLAHLVKRGLVIKGPRLSQPGCGKGGAVSFYFLTPAAVGIYERFCNGKLNHSNAEREQLGAVTPAGDRRETSRGGRPGKHRQEVRG